MCTNRIKMARRAVALAQTEEPTPVDKANDKFISGLSDLGDKGEVIGGDKWLSLRQYKDPENGVNGYTYSHEDRCNGHIVSVLPFRFVDGKVELLLRSEITPCWGMEPAISSITGGCEPGSTPAEDTVRELEEEAGYTVTVDDLVSLGECRGTKSSDSVYHLFTVDLTGKEKGEAVGDGSELEAKAHCYWSTGDLDQAQDPMLYVCFARAAELITHAAKEKASH